MSQKFKLDIDKDQLFFITEAMILILFSVAEKKVFLNTAKIATDIMCVDMVVSVENTLRDILREPLMDSSFRLSFYEHFKKHPSNILSNFGVEALEEILEFVDD